MSDSFLLLLVGLLGLGVGFALGLAVALLRPPRAAPVEAVQEQPASPIESRAPVEPVPASPPIVEVTAPLPVPAPPARAAFPEANPPRISLNPIDILARAIQSDARPAPAAPKSIAAQVDEVLQEMLKNSSLESRAIRLLELPGKGMVVMVGLDQYDGVDAVPDEAIRGLLRGAVAEWEIRTAGQKP